LTSKNKFNIIINTSIESFLIIERICRHDAILKKFKIMKTKLTLTSIIILGFLVASCKVQVDLINDEFPEAKQEVMETFGAIAQSINDGDLDKLISFHAYGPKFTEFKNGEPRNGDEANETHERNVFGSVTEVVKFAANDLQIAVYGDVANLTFHSDFHLKFGDDLVVVNDQITLLFVKTNDGWMMVHEHHSPLKKD
jgi:ketosteroid isomerase-like protein